MPFDFSDDWHKNSVDDQGFFESYGERVDALKHLGDIDAFIYRQQRQSVEEYLGRIALAGKVPIVIKDASFGDRWKLAYDNGNWFLNNYDSVDDLLDVAHKMHNQVGHFDPATLLVLRLAHEMNAVIDDEDTVCISDPSKPTQLDFFKDLPKAA